MILHKSLTLESPSTGYPRFWQLPALQTGTTNDIAGIEIGDGANGNPEPGGWSARSVVGGVGEQPHRHYVTPSTSSAKKNGLSCFVLTLGPVQVTAPLMLFAAGTRQSGSVPFFLDRKIASRGWDHAMMMALVLRVERMDLQKDCGRGMECVVELRLLRCWAWRA